MSQHDFYDAKGDNRTVDLKLKEDWLTCIVCNHVFDFGKYAPHQLPCGDTVCLSCLRDFAGKNGKAEEMFCPVCDRTIAVPGGHVCCFPPNAGRLKILEVFKIVEAHRKEIVPCIGCDDPATSRCLECQENYCLEHARFHSIVAATKHHTVVSFGEILQEPQKILRANGAQMCSKHVNNYLEAVCTTCNALCCLVCAITDHKGHNVKEIGDTMKTIKDRIGPLMKKVEVHTYGIKQTYGIAKDVDKEMNIMFQRCKRDLNIGFMGMTRGIRDRQHDLFQDVDKLLKVNQGTLADQIHSLEDEINFTIRGQYMLKEIFDEWSPAEVAGIGAQVKNLLDDLQNIPSNLNLEPLPTRRVVFDCREGEAKFVGSAKRFGNLRVSEVQLSLEPKETHYESDDEEENLLPIDNSELSTLVKEQMSGIAT